MLGKNLLEGRTGPQTQSVEAVKALLTWKGRAVDPLPSVVEFANEGEESRLVLVLSNKKLYRDREGLQLPIRDLSPSHVSTRGSTSARSWNRPWRAASGLLADGFNGPVDEIPGVA